LKTKKIVESNEIIGATGAKTKPMSITMTKTPTSLPALTDLGEYFTVRSCGVTAQPKQQQNLFTAIHSTPGCGKIKRCDGK
jgi:hypothetical protein|tara:strand:- start:309 stop:551 length:243 start_codon:yes stop_codon:yes gene_type:complete